jgi:hypothetical protein
MENITTLEIRHYDPAKGLAVQMRKPWGTEKDQSAFNDLICKPNLLHKWKTVCNTQEPSLL